MRGKLPHQKERKTRLNYVATYNDFERRFAMFLDKANDILRFACLTTKEQGDSGTPFRVDYLKPTGAIVFYDLNFVVVQKDRKKSIGSSKLKGVSGKEQRQRTRIWNCVATATPKKPARPGDLDELTSLSLLNANLQPSPIYLWRKNGSSEYSLDFGIFKEPLVLSWRLEMDQNGGHEFEKGQIVRNLKQPQWGLGRILEIRGPNKVRVLFEDGKDRVLDLTLVTLELVDEAAAPSRFSSRFDSLAPLPNVDMSKLRSACELFISVMENRRSTSDDAGVARRVIEEMETRGKLTLTTFRRLAQWCHTEGSFQEGVDMAQDISRAIYGRVISREEVE